MQFLMVPYNLMKVDGKAAYLDRNLSSGAGQRS